MRSILRSTVLALLVPLTFVACDDEDPPTEIDPGPYTLTFTGDATFQGPHGGQDIRIALIRTDDQTIVEEDAATVTESGDDGFSFTFTEALEAEVSYEIAYWIDSNFNGGAAGVCEGIDVDHQWRVQVGTVTEDGTLTETHDPSTRSDVCDVFAAELTFQGDASFQGAHGGQTVTALLLNEDGDVLADAAGTVSVDADPSFSFTFAGLARGTAFEVRYWIDSNFGGGELGVCDPSITDHQWSVDIAPLSGDDTHTEDHRPGEVEEVCDSFTADLTFQGDDTFQGAHGGQTVTAGLIDGDGNLVGVEEGVVSANADPSFSLVFEDGLIRGRTYRVAYWIDSNFRGGNEGVCDEPDDDHQWSVDLGTASGDLTHTEDHRPSEVEPVCDSFI